MARHTLTVMETMFAPIKADSFLTMCRWTGIYWRISALISVPLGDLIANDIEWLNDYADQRILPEEAQHIGMADFGYQTVSANFPSIGLPFGNGLVFIQVEADVTDVIDELYHPETITAWEQVWSTPCRRKSGVEDENA